MQAYPSSIPDLLVRVLQKAGLLHRFNLYPTIRIGAKRFIVPLSRGVGVGNLRGFEPWMQHMITHLPALFPGLFLDVGVNIGQTLLKVKAHAPQLTYAGFEPNPACLAYVHDLIKRNKIENVSVFPVALGDHDGIIELVLNQDNPVDSSATVIPDFRPKHRVFQRLMIPGARFTTLEPLLPTEAVGFVKIDVEGSEYGVLRSMQDRIARDRPAIILEILPVHHAGNTQRLERQQAVESLFRTLDYEMLRLRGPHLPLKLERMQGPIGIHADQSLSNFLILPRDKVAAAMQVLGTELQ